MSRLKWALRHPVLDLGGASSEHIFPLGTAIFNAQQHVERATQREGRRGARSPCQGLEAPASYLFQPESTLRVFPAGEFMSASEESSRLPDPSET